MGGSKLFWLLSRGIGRVERCGLDDIGGLKIIAGAKVLMGGLISWSMFARDGAYWGRMGSCK